MKRTAGAILIAALVIGLVALFALPAGAHHKDGHSKGQGQAHGNEGQAQSHGDEGQAQSHGKGAERSAERGSDGGSATADGAGKGKEAATRPPGNNGTVKIDGEPFDSHPDNQPHVGCVFQIDFYGYDEGDLEATYELDLHPPTDGDVIASGSVPIGEDPAGGGTDLDAFVEIDLTQPLLDSGVEAHPIQGWHIKLTVHAEGSIGADVKHKVFWVNCPAEEEEDVEAGAVTQEQKKKEAAEQVLGGAEAAPEAAAKGGVSVLGRRVVAGRAPARAARGAEVAAAGAELPFTGGALVAFVILGLAGIGTGTAMLRHRPKHSIR